MKVYVDDQPYEFAADDSQALSMLVDEVRQRADADSRMVVAVCCDGNDVTGDGFEETLTTPMSSYERVDLYTAEPRDLVKDALEQAEAQLEAGAGERAKVLELFGAGRTSEAVAQLGHCMQSWYQVHQAIAYSLAILNMDVGGLEVGGQSVRELLKATRERLCQVRDALQARDFVLLSDTLQYEFDEVIDTWRAVAHLIREQP